MRRTSHDIVYVQRLVYGQYFTEMKRQTRVLETILYHTSERVHIFMAKIILPLKCDDDTYFILQVFCTLESKRLRNFVKKNNENPQIYQRY